MRTKTSQCTLDCDEMKANTNCVQGDWKNQSPASFERLTRTDVIPNLGGKKQSRTKYNTNI